MAEFNFDPQAYLSTFTDVQKWINDGKQAGMNTGTSYKDAYGVDTAAAGWEEGWLAGLNNMYGRQADDMDKFTDDEIARYHYDTYGKNEDRIKNSTEYQNKVAANASTYVPWDAKYGVTPASEKKGELFETVLNNS